MGIITENVEITLHSKNSEYYEKLGYKIPRYYNKNSCTYRIKRGTKIIVKISDVPLNSMVKVDVECNCCHSKIIIPYQRYNRYNKDEKYFCGKCAARIYNSGSNNHSWNPNKTEEERITKRHFKEYKYFTRKVLARDHYICKCCKKRGGILEVHHLNGYNWFIEGRTDEKNAVSLCKNCHSSFHSIYGNGNNTKDQFEQWLGKSVELLEKYNGVLPIGKQLICYENNVIYESPIDFEEKTKITAQRVIDCCNKKDFIDSNNHRHRSIKISNKHYFWLDDFKNMTKNDFNKYFDWCKPIKSNNSGKNNYLSKSVICLTTLKIFDCVSDAVKEYSNTAVTNITRCCEGKRKHSGKLKDGTKLTWMYYKDYLESTTSSEVSA